MMKKQCNRLACAGGLTAAVFMLVLSVLNSLGIYESATMAMQDWHMFYTPDVFGTIAGMVEAFVVTYAVIAVGVAIYEKLGKKK